jgi:hypothetical protein
MGSAESSNTFLEAVIKYFRKKGYKTERNVTLDGYSGLSHTFDLVIKRGQEQRLVWVRDWKRTIGVNMIINLDKASEDVGLPNPIMISDKFSGHVKAYANRRGITLIQKRQILSAIE